MLKRKKRTPSVLYQIKQLWKGHCPGQLVIQITDRCNARCPQCGMRAAEPFKRSDINLYETKCILDRAAELGVKAVSFTGGEPMLRLKDVIRLSRYAKDVGIDFIRTGTNGFVFQQRGGNDELFNAWMRTLVFDLVNSPIRNFWISIDSCIPEIHEQMRGFPGVIEGIRRALPRFHENGFFPSANLGINRNILGSKTMGLKPEDFPSEDQYLDAFEEVFYEAFCRFYAFVIDLGFTIVNACYPMSSAEGSGGGNCDAVYAAASSDRIVSFSDQEKIRLFRALSSAIEAYRSKIRIFTPQVSLYMLIKQYEGQIERAHPCRGGIDYFYINAQDRRAYPCGYRGFDDLGDFTKIRKLPDPQGKNCLLCDWECFRDPSELFGPISDFLQSPLKAWRHWKEDKEYFRLWRNDWQYYLACDWFNGRKGLPQKKLSEFTAVSPGPIVRPDRPVPPIFSEVG